MDTDKHQWKKAGWFLSDRETQSPNGDCQGDVSFSLSVRKICVHLCSSVVSAAWLRIGWQRCQPPPIARRGTPHLVRAPGAAAPAHFPPALRQGVCASTSAVGRKNPSKPKV